MSSIKIYQGDALSRLKELPANSVHAVCTSPPYWGGLRDYNVDGQLGLESTVEEHVAVMTEIAMEIFRVLHPSGCFLMNYGDMYCSRVGRRDPNGLRQGAIPIIEPRRDRRHRNLKPKDQVGMPAELALSFRDHGWYWRNDIIWYKTNALTTSAKDRWPTTHEYVMFFTKRSKYFFNANASREITGKEATWEEYSNAEGSIHNHENDSTHGMLQEKNPNFKVLTHPLGRMRRTVWPIPTQPINWHKYGKKHCARFPEKLAELCILSTTSEHCCSKCLKPYKQITEEFVVDYDKGNRVSADIERNGSVLSTSSMLRTGKFKAKKPIGWEADCKCAAEKRPCTVLDPFSGTGTTLLVASNHGRDAIGIELNPDDVKLSQKWIFNNSRNRLFNQVEVIL